MPDTSFRVYSQGSRYLKDPGFYEQVGGIKNSVLMLVDPEAHKRRRCKIAGLFSSKATHQLAPRVLEIVNRGIGRAKLANKKGIY